MGMHNTGNHNKKEDILRLRAEGKTYREIQKITGASKGTISYHCGEGQRNKHATRQRKWRESDKSKTKLFSRISRFKRKMEPAGLPDPYETNRAKIRKKVWDFATNRGEHKADWGVDDFLERFSSVSECYLTGTAIDINDPDTFSLDHIVPRSMGGSNDISNVGIASAHANQAKSDMGLEEFVMMCFDVVEHWMDYEEQANVIAIHSALKREMNLEGND